MSYSSVWSSVPGATACVMIGLMVACRTVGNICRLTAPPRWIRPRTGGFSFSSVPRPGAPGSLRRRPGRPFFDLAWLALMPGDTINLIDLGSAFPLRDRRPSEQTLAKLLGHRLHVRGIQAQFLSDLPVGEVQPHQIEAQDPHAERLMMSRQHRAGQVVEPSMARLAQVALSMPLSFIMAVADDHGTVAVRAAHAIRPAMLTHKFKALGLVQQAREIDHLGYRHACAASSNNRITSSSDQIRDLASALPHPEPPPRNPTRATIHYSQCPAGRAVIAAGLPLAHS